MKGKTWTFAVKLTISFLLVQAVTIVSGVIGLYGNMENAAAMETLRHSVSASASAEAGPQVVAGPEPLNRVLGQAIERGVFLKNLTLISMILGVIAAVALNVVLVRNTNGTLRNIASHLVRDAQSVASVSGEVSSASQALAERVCDQASAVEEMVGSIEEMTQSVRQTAANAGKANELSSAAGDSVALAREIIERMTLAIEDIRTSSDATAQIVRVISNIAAQTNLLALNAAVEAARAGEAGKGFAVVAEEVQHLAQRSAEAAESTRDMILTSQKHAEKAVSVAGESMLSLVKTRQSVEEVIDCISDVSQTSQAQAVGIEQIDKAVNHVGQMTHAGAAGAQQTAAAVEQLSAQAGDLNAMVDQLTRLVDGARPSATGTRFLAQRRSPGPAGRRTPTAGQSHVTQAKRYAKV